MTVNEKKNIQLMEAQVRDEISFFFPGGYRHNSRMFLHIHRKKKPDVRLTESSSLPLAYSI